MVVAQKLRWSAESLLDLFSAYSKAGALSDLPAPRGLFWQFMPDWIEQIEEDLGSLPRRDARRRRYEALRMLAVDGLELKPIAQTLGVSVTVVSRWSRAYLAQRGAHLYRMPPRSRGDSPLPAPGRPYSSLAPGLVGSPFAIGGVPSFITEFGPSVAVAVVAATAGVWVGGRVTRRLGARRPLLATGLSAVLGGSLAGLGGVLILDPAVSHPLLVSLAAGVLTSVGGYMRHRRQAVRVRWRHSREERERLIRARARTTLAHALELLEGALDPVLYYKAGELIRWTPRRFIRGGARPTVPAEGRGEDRVLRAMDLELVIDLGAVEGLIEALESVSSEAPVFDTWALEAATDWVVFREVYRIGVAAPVALITGTYDVDALVRRATTLGVATLLSELGISENVAWDVQRARAEEGFARVFVGLRHPVGIRVENPDLLLGRLAESSNVGHVFPLEPAAVEATLSTANEAARSVMEVRHLDENAFRFREAQMSTFIALVHARAAQEQAAEVRDQRRRESRGKRQYSLEEALKQLAWAEQRVARSAGELAVRGELLLDGERRPNATPTLTDAVDWITAFERTVSRRLADEEPLPEALDRWWQINQHQLSDALRVTRRRHARLRDELAALREGAEPNGPGPGAQPQSAAAPGLVALPFGLNGTPSTTAVVAGAATVLVAAIILAPRVQRRRAVRAAAVPAPPRGRAPPSRGPGAAAKGDTGHGEADHLASLLKLAWAAEAAGQRARAEQLFSDFARRAHWVLARGGRDAVRVRRLLRRFRREHHVPPTTWRLLLGTSLNALHDFARQRREQTSLPELGEPIRVALAAADARTGLAGDSRARLSTGTVYRLSGGALGVEVVRVPLLVTGRGVVDAYVLDSAGRHAVAEMPRIAVARGIRTLYLVLEPNARPLLEQEGGQLLVAYRAQGGGSTALVSRIRPRRRVFPSRLETMAVHLRLRIDPAAEELVGRAIAERLPNVDREDLPQPVHNLGELLQIGRDRLLGELRAVAEALAEELSARFVDVSGSDDPAAARRLAARFAGRQGGPSVIVAPLKSLERSRQKLELAGGDNSVLFDVVRATVVVRRADELPGALDALARVLPHSGLQIAATRNGLHDGERRRLNERGHGDIRISLRNSDGYHMELRLSALPLWRVSVLGNNYERYRAQRDVLYRVTRGQRSLSAREAASGAAMRALGRRAGTRGWAQALAVPRGRLRLPGRFVPVAALPPVRGGSPWLPTLTDMAPLVAAAAVLAVATVMAVRSAQRYRTRARTATRRRHGKGPTRVRGRQLVARADSSGVGDSSDGHGGRPSRRAARHGGELEALRIRLSEAQEAVARARFWPLAFTGWTIDQLLADRTLAREDAEALVADVLGSSLEARGEGDVEQLNARLNGRPAPAPLPRVLRQAEAHRAMVQRYEELERRLREAKRRRPASTRRAETALLRAPVSLPAWIEPLVAEPEVHLMRREFARWLGTRPAQLDELERARAAAAGRNDPTPLPPSLRHAWALRVLAKLLEQADERGEDGLTGLERAERELELERERAIAGLAGGSRRRAELAAAAPGLLSRPALRRALTVVRRAELALRRQLEAGRPDLRPRPTERNLSWSIVASTGVLYGAFYGNVLVGDWQRIQSGFMDAPVWFAMQLGAALIALPLINLAKTVGRATFMLGSVAVAAAGQALNAMAGEAWITWVAAGLIGAGSMAGVYAGFTWLADRVDAEGKREELAGLTIERDLAKLMSRYAVWSVVGLLAFRALPELLAPYSWRLAAAALVPAVLGSGLLVWTQAPADRMPKMRSTTGRRPGLRRVGRFAWRELRSAYAAPLRLLRERPDARLAAAGALLMGGGLTAFDARSNSALRAYGFGWVVPWAGFNILGGTFILNALSHLADRRPGTYLTTAAAGAALAAAVLLGAEVSFPATAAWLGAMVAGHILLEAFATQYTIGQPVIMKRRVPLDQGVAVQTLVTQAKFVGHTLFAGLAALAYSRSWGGSPWAGAMLVSGGALAAALGIHALYLWVTRPVRQIPAGGVSATGPAGRRLAAGALRGLAGIRHVPRRLLEHAIAALWRVAGAADGVGDRRWARAVLRHALHDAVASVREGRGGAAEKLRRLDPLLGAAEGAALEARLRLASIARHSARAEVRALAATQARSGRHHRQPRALRSGGAIDLAGDPVRIGDLASQPEVARDILLRDAKAAVEARAGVTLVAEGRAPEALARAAALLESVGFHVFARSSGPGYRVEARLDGGEAGG